MDLKVPHPTTVIVLILCFGSIIAPTPMTYIKTSGKREKGVGIHRIPERIEVANCLGRCQQTPSCVCMRISNTGNGVCEVFTNMSDPNILKTTGFVYYAAAMYKKTLETDSLALAKPSYQSSTYRLKNVKYTADRANDGNRNVEGFLQPYFAHTKDGPESEPWPWWQVDLEDEYVITGIYILNRRNWAFRLHDIQIRVGHVKLTKKWDDIVFEENSLCGENVGGGIGDAVVRKFICLPCPLHGRYISVQIIKFCDDCPESDANVLQLAEVDVYGFKHTG